MIYDGVKEKFPFPNAGVTILLTTELPWQGSGLKIIKFEETPLLLRNSIGEDEKNFSSLIKQIPPYPLLVRLVSNYIYYEDLLQEKDLINLKFIPEKIKAQGEQEKFLEKTDFFEKWQAGENPAGPRLSQNYEKAIVTVLSLILTKLQIQCPKAVNWLHVSSYLYAKQIPSAWIFDWLTQAGRKNKKASYPSVRKSYSF